MLSAFGLEPTNALAVDVGDTFGRLTVLTTGQIPDTYRYKAVCRCECGSDLIAVRFDHLLMGVTTSCGCVQKERSTTHGMTSSGHLGRWRHMMDRCYNPECKAYPDYGGRGIRVCDEWHDVAKFVAALPSSYRKGLDIDRINNDGNYEPGNIRWATRKVNSGNRRSARLITHNGKTQSLTDWAEETGIGRKVIQSRLDDWNWDASRALTEPAADKAENMVKAQKLRWAGHIKKPEPTPRVEKTALYRGELRTIAELSKMSGFEVRLLRKRIFERKWPVEKAMNTKPA